MVGYKSSYILAEVFYKVETDHHFNSTAASGWALAKPTRNLGAQLTLLQPGGHIMPTTFLLAHPDLKSQRHL